MQIQQKAFFKASQHGYENLPIKEIYVSSA